VSLAARWYRKLRLIYGIKYIRIGNTAEAMPVKFFIWKPTKTPATREYCTTAVAFVARLTGGLVPMRFHPQKVIFMSIAIACTVF
jgi:hypothetical protein